MTSLTQTSITARKIIRYGIFVILALIIGKFILTTSIKIYKKIFPPPPPPPTVTFGKLPKLPFPEKQKINLNLVLETPQGALPTLAPQVKVFFMPKTTANLLSLDLAKEKAKALGFRAEPQEISDTLYRFINENSASTLEINIISGIFSLSYDLSRDSSPLQDKPPAPEVAASQIRSYLSSADLFPQDLTGLTTHEFLKFSEGKFVSAVSLSEADLLKINFFRKTYDNLTLFTPNPNEANVWFITGGSRERDKQIIAGQFHYFPIDETQSATYPIKTAETAWQELTSGSAYIATYGVNKEGATVKIRRIYLGYYDSGIYNEFLQPIVVLEGDKGFVAYLPAVTPDYYGE